MSLKLLLFTISMGGLILAFVLFIFIGQITVRKLRKNPETKDELGFEFVSGWDIFNVAGALALPRWLNKKLRSTPVPSLYANAELLDKHTSRFDRILSAIFYILWMGSAFILLGLIILDAFNLFD